MKKTKSLILSFILLLVVGLFSVAFTRVNAADKHKLNVKDGSKEYIEFEDKNHKDGAELEEGTKVTFTIKKDKLPKDKKVDKVLNDATELKADKNGKYTVTVEKKDITLSVELKNKAKSKLTFAAEEHKDKFVFENNVEFGKEYQEGEIVKFTIKPESVPKDKNVVKVTVNGNEIQKDADGKYTFTVGEDGKEIKLGVTFEAPKADKNKKMSGTTIAAIVILVIAILVPAIMAIVKKIQVAKAEKQQEKDLQEGVQEDFEDKAELEEKEETTEEKTEEEK